MGKSPLTILCVILDDKLEDLEEANPFSFKEFLKTKNLGLSKEDTTNSRIYPKVYLSCHDCFRRHLF
jgi:predicted AAA+ superfamily ATPase